MAFPIVVSPVRAVHCDVSPDQLAWVNDGPDNHMIDGYPGPGWDADRFEPSPEAAAQECGWQAGYRLDLGASPDSDLGDLARACWVAGYAQGAAQRRQDDEERSAFERDLAESAFRYRRAVESDEVIRAVGCIAARQERGQS